MEPSSEANARAPGLTAVMSASSRKVHDYSNGLVQLRLVVLFTDRQLWGRALGSFYHVYHALEGAVEEALQHPDLKPFAEDLSATTGMFRTPGFEEDLCFFLGCHWPDKILPGPAVSKYVDHLQLLGKTHPTLLLAHVYTQHLAMLSGGQVIKRLARKRLELPEDYGTKAFDVSEKLSLNTLRQRFKDKLDTLGKTMSAETWQQMLEEHQYAFKANNQIISEFRVGWLPFTRGIVRLVPPIAQVSVLLCVAVAAAVALTRISH
mmetsp:Transcript_20700/g.35419  ORF Transcript_20700/g.35419 Transcript_20700/m.35419 type:complete len:263 (+) Transcript_20700:84-872(+)|eukprot:CAMPEP_0119107462 /NCGR_PEP_ID=MMETSP1180-20130426/10284_1 /TAXON_ID=3052 ORGANISM="Chlamydomonas cf sp, Strain CCMP681" /NCGR_SAMPLE_ID=MMETSP1180 /ASSEMBLY_ACC=CAM_ASM_000741 /LENGTH=262 /DNA_ID=CAMNT_0007092949 /DNA_START=84 /DNA_END=872 /DNA_ORIENTATION=+